MGRTSEIFQGTDTCQTGPTIGEVQNIAVLSGWRLVAVLKVVLVSFSFLCFGLLTPIHLVCSKIKHRVLTQLG